MFLGVKLLIFLAKIYFMNNRLMTIFMVLGITFVGICFGSDGRCTPPSSEMARGHVETPWGGTSRRMNWGLLPRPTPVVVMVNGKYTQSSQSSQAGMVSRNPYGEDNSSNKRHRPENSHE